MLLVSNRLLEAALSCCNRLFLQANMSIVNYNYMMWFGNNLDIDRCCRRESHIRVFHKFYTGEQTRYYRSNSKRALWFLMTDLDSMTLTNATNCKIYGSMDSIWILILWISSVIS